jgi:predicted esterase YcpF (UPF0227 family)
MAASGLHPAFDPAIQYDDDAYSQQDHQQELVEQFEYAIEVELAQLRSQEVGRIQMDRFVRLLQTTRDEQIRTRELLERVLDILGTAA